jgi:uncharacterized damage-inducible protein DinB
MGQRLVIYLENFKEVIMRIALLLCGLVAAGTIVSAQEKRAPAPTIASELDSLLSATESDFVSAAEAMPEEKYSFRPASGEFKGVRTFAQEVKHVAFANHLFYGAIVGEKAEAGPEREGPESIRTKAEILRYLRESFALGHRAIRTITADNAVTIVGNAPVPRFSTRLAMAAHAIAHAYDHYGQIIEYLRINGIVPPASQPQATGSGGM